MKPLRPHDAAACALWLALTATGMALAQKTVQTPKPSRAQLAAELAATLQACSFDGSPVRFSPPDLSRGGSGGQEVVAQIMRYTGLPANFVVVEGPVPNAAAIIMPGPDRVPRRVIAYNKAFMSDVVRATQSNNWAPVSIMAHEIGHHLSGHTIVPGGSQPPIELESDKFSGFVLYRMGAGLADAQHAIAALIPEQDGPTHPGRRKRLAAIAEGWIQACELQGGAAACQGGAALKPAATTPAAAATQARAAAAQTLPAPQGPSLPAKAGQFVYDEFGFLDAALRKGFEQQMHEHARQTGVEIVTLLVKDLHGMRAQDYAWAMLRQLRVGKLDVGNGAVLVVAPQQREAAVALGPGVQLEMQAHDTAAHLRRWIDTGWKMCEKKAACGMWTESLLLSADHIRRDTRHLDWKIGFHSLGDMVQAAAAESGTTGGADAGRVWRKLVRLSGTVENLHPPVGHKQAWVNEPKLLGGQRKAVLLRSQEGLAAMLYLDAQTEALQPGGPLQAGKTYTLVARESGVTGNPGHTQSLDVLSYAVAQ